MCKSTEPVGVSSGTVFWVNCDKCVVWVHYYCTFQKNAVTRQLICKNCSECIYSKINQGKFKGHRNKQMLISSVIGYRICRIYLSIF